MLSPAELTDWYRRLYIDNAYTHSEEHDRTVARTRLKAYGLSPTTKLLDVGCGRGAFVAQARDDGIDAWGQDLSEASAGAHVYCGALDDIAFPTESFDVVTVHDVLEHVLDPGAMLDEIARILRRPGKLILDFPRFFHEAGEHHWKAVEHLWMFTEEQLRGLLILHGFSVTAIKHPIMSKVVLEAERRSVERPQILVPPGIGDSLWSITKLPGFLREYGFGLPDVWVQDAGGPKRTQPFLRTLPMLHAAGYRRLSDKDPIFHEAYMQKGRTVFKNIGDCDYFIAYNGVMRHGATLEETDTQYGCAWRPKMHVSKEASAMRETMAGPGRYILAYFAEAGMYRRWLQQYSADLIVQTLHWLEDEFDCRIVVMGAPWDRGQIGRDIARADPKWIDLIGATSFDQMLGLIDGALAVVGFPAGNTILATVRDRPTVLLWNQYFNRTFWQASCPPDAPYVYLDTAGLVPETVVKAVHEAIDLKVYANGG